MNCKSSRKWYVREYSTESRVMLILNFHSGGLFSFRVFSGINLFNFSIVNFLQRNFENHNILEKYFNVSVFWLKLREQLKSWAGIALFCGLWARYASLGRLCIIILLKMRRLDSARMRRIDRLGFRANAVRIERHGGHQQMLRHPLRRRPKRVIPTFIHSLYADNQI